MLTLLYVYLVSHMHQTIVVNASEIDQLPWLCLLYNSAVPGPRGLMSFFKEGSWLVLHKKVSPSIRIGSLLSGWVNFTIKRIMVYDSTHNVCRCTHIPSWCLLSHIGWWAEYRGPDRDGVNSMASQSPAWLLPLYLLVSESWSLPGLRQNCYSLCLCLSHWSMGLAGQRPPL